MLYKFNRVQMPRIQDEDDREPVEDPNPGPGPKLPPVEDPKRAGEPDEPPQRVVSR